MKRLRGNLVIGQSGGPTAVINSSVCGVVSAALQQEGIEEIYGMVHGIQGFLQEDMADLRRETPGAIQGLLHTPSAALGSCRYKVKPEDYEQIVAICRVHNIRYFFYIGGGDSMDTVYETLHAAYESGWELKVMGIPKTIDNDLILTDHCPGYGSAARYLAITFSEIKRDTLALTLTERVKILEVMGRNTGWLTAATVLAGDYGPDLIYLPERPFYEEAFLGEVDDVVRRRGCAVIAACEGIRHADGNFVAMNTDPLNQDAFGHPEPGGVGHRLTELVMERLKLKARYDKPGTMQRCSGLGASRVDMREAYNVGWEAVKRAVTDENGKMITLEREAGETYCCTTGTVPLEKVKNAEKKMPAEYIGEDRSRLTAAFEAYARPLLGEPLPEYVRLNLERVPKRISR